jgi:hypothetical protein
MNKEYLADVFAGSIAHGGLARVFNQLDNKERGHQVRQMGSIYTIMPNKYVSG